MALKYRGLTPKGTERVDLSQLASEPDPAHVTYQLLRQARGEQARVQEVEQAGPVRSGQVRLPDMTGWPLRQALRRSIELGAVPEIRGTGLLASQSPPPGAVLTKGGALLLEFEPAS
jgi:cell division protein FtsI (penicillin-binding protein 3)